MITRLALFAAVLLAAGATADDKLTPAEQLKILEKLSPSFVRVEYTLQYDKSQAPQGYGWREKCSNCGGYHYREMGETLVTEERPAELAGYALSPTLVVAPDPIIHPRFVRSIAVRYGDQVVDAKPDAWLIGQVGVLLALSEPLKGVQPLEFKADAESPYFALTYSNPGARWTAQIQPLAQSVISTDGTEQNVAAPSYGLIVDKAGTPVGMALNEKLPLDGSWKGSPADWPQLATEEYARLVARVEEITARGVPRITLNFRSPKKRTGESYWRYRSGGEEGSTEQNTLGVLIGDTTLLVLSSLQPEVTARLERIKVHTPDGGTVSATFQHTLRDYGCFVAKLEKPLPGALKMDFGDLRKHENRLLPAAQVLLYGDQKVTHCDHLRIPSFSLGWKKRVFPDLPGESPGVFLFDRAGALLAFPLAKRQHVRSEWGWREDDTPLTPVGHLQEVLADPAKHADMANVPLGEAEENRVAWLGVELQPLDAELARVNKVAHLTENGSLGAIVSYVHEKSPAADAGIEPGVILLRLHIDDHPTPLDVKADQDGRGGDPFPWDRLDELPEQYYDQVPKPWPPVENVLTRTLTDFGIGREYKVEYSHNGEIAFKELEIVECPPHFDSAPRFKSEDLGLTVRDLTFEARRYFQKKADEPGVIVSTLEPGSKASVAGIKPYELITHVNDEPVMNAGDFERLTAPPGELRLAVKRMTRGRLVKVTSSGVKPKPKKEPDSEG